MHTLNTCVLIWVSFVLVKKLLRNITDYYGDVLRTNPPNLPSDELPNLSSIAKTKSIPDIVKFLRLVLALAVKSDKKEDYVQKIYTLSPEAQKALMHVLQQVCQIIYYFKYRWFQTLHQHTLQAMGQSGRTQYERC
jgi:HOOK domain